MWTLNWPTPETQELTGWNFLICPHVLTTEQYNRGKINKVETVTHGKRKGVKFYSEKLNETGLMRYRSKKNIKINLKQTHDDSISHFIQLKIRSSCGLLWNQWLTFRLHERSGTCNRLDWSLWGRMEVVWLGWDVYSVGKPYEKKLRILGLYRSEKVSKKGILHAMGRKSRKHRCNKGIRSHALQPSVAPVESSYIPNHICLL
jgi:hypothetical protein